ncbi:MAG: phosphoribosylformylglycinamidine synthase subunit PurL [Acidobacteriota bacterium]|nr:phosphoribosylformylglycinamidine synthase subunit PurL [Acidobacteriota bacterium]
MNKAEITPKLIEEHGISPAEYERIKEIMGREPNFTELGVFSVMWSEHCSYKSSRVHLKRLPTTGSRVVVPPGENAGVVDIGDGWCVAFKVESHNHPSFIEPFQGAATGVGGILRDVFTMGARPIAAMNSLRFGHLEDKKHGNRNKSILKGVVEGIAHYGNCFGVPTIGGEVVFDEAYNLNPLVNAFALGIVREDQIFFGKASGVGNPVMYVGAKTGRDGIHGATMASAEFDDEALEKRPTVQVGDPFLEKLLLEACLEAMRSGAIEGIQDMGAAGLTSSSVEMADRAGNGLELYLDDVPQRETEMTAYEMLLSESQERMLIVAKKGREKELIEIFNKWDLDAVVIGKVVEGNRLKIYHHNELMADMPVDKLTESAPLYNRPMAAPQSSEFGVQSSELEKKQKTLNAKHGTLNCNDVLRRLLESPNICSKHFVYEQYDHMVRTNTAVLPGADASVVRVKETRRAISMCLDGNGRFSAVNPKEGAKLTVAEAARNNVCVGGKPIAVTNCLNFASPERPKIMWAFSETIDGIKEACEMFETPVISGNVSFYNETDGDGVLPTPTIGMVGLIEDTKKIITQGFKNEGDIIALLGTTNDDLSVSEYAQTILGYTTNELIEIGEVPKIDLHLEKKVQDTCLKLNAECLINSAHDCSDGGIAVAIAEQCFSSLNDKSNGAEIELNDENFDVTTQLFSESPSRILVTFSEENLDKVKEAIGDCPFEVIGKVTGEDLKIKVNGKEEINAKVADLQDAWKNSLEEQLSVE